MAQFGQSKRFLIPDGSRLFEHALYRSGFELNPNYRDGDLASDNGLRGPDDSDSLTIPWEQRTTALGKRLAR